MWAWAPVRGRSAPITTVVADAPAAQPPTATRLAAAAAAVAARAVRPSRLVRLPPPRLLSLGRALLVRRWLLIGVPSLGLSLLIRVLFVGLLRIGFLFVGFLFVGVGSQGSCGGLVGGGPGGEEFLGGGDRVEQAEAECGEDEQRGPYLGQVGAGGADGEPEPGGGAEQLADHRADDRQGCGLFAAVEDLR